MYKPFDLGSVIRRRLDEDPALALGVVDALIESQKELQEYVTQNVSEAVGRIELGRHGDAVELLNGIVGDLGEQSDG